MTPIEPAAQVAVVGDKELRRGEDGKLEQWVQVLAFHDKELEDERDALRALKGMEPKNLSRLTRAIALAQQKTISVDQALQIEIDKIEELLKDAPPPKEGGGK